MIGYKDMTFCSQECGNADCHRNITEDVKRGGEAWWGSADFPIAVADYSQGCPDYIPIQVDLYSH